MAAQEQGGKGFARQQHKLGAFKEEGRDEILCAREKEGIGDKFVLMLTGLTGG